MNDLIIEVEKIADTAALWATIEKLDTMLDDDQRELLNEITDRLLSLGLTEEP